MTESSAPTLPAAQARLGAYPFWIVAFAFLIVMSFATLPSPLYGIYSQRDGLSAFTITVVYAIFAVGVIAVLLAVPTIARRIGRRGVMLGGVATMIVAAGVLAAWKDLPGLLLGRFATGIAAGLVSGTAITYLIELDLRRDPGRSPIRARNIGTAISVGALGIGPLVAGCLAAWARDPLTVPYLVWIALGAVALVALAAVPETGAAAAPVTSGNRTRPRARIPARAGTATMAAFSANGLFAGLAGLFLAVTFHHPSHALAGATLFIVFSAGVASQLVTARLRPPTVLALGSVSMLAGLVLLATSVRLSSPNLALFLIGGALIGAGAGSVFKGTTGIVLEAAAPEDRLAITSQLLIALMVGLSIPVIGAGVALDQGVSAPNTVLAFAILVGLGVAGAGWGLLARRPKTSPRGRAPRSRFISSPRRSGCGR
jgi:MFS family permease